jgi:beta-lactamase superfamily II metal-dependent hydrolase
MIRHIVLEFMMLARCAVVTAMAGCLFLWESAQAAPQQPLEIYFIDVEGGQSTLVVTPERHSLLIDTRLGG